MRGLANHIRSIQGNIIANITTNERIRPVIPDHRSSTTLTRLRISKHISSLCNRILSLSTSDTNEIGVLLSSTTYISLFTHESLLFFLNTPL